MKNTVKVPPLYKRLLYLTLTSSWVSGSVYFILDTWFPVQGEFGLSKNPYQYFFLQIHGGSAFLMMILYGLFLGTHVSTSISKKEMRKLGLTITGLIGFLISTAYLLYYLSNETLREITRYAHASVGFSLPFILASHILTASNYKKRSASS
ncbi:hypothetical protein DID77_02570 [Candidatus Marinamargulisbacteria bacterium SCGC AG-439-L15]|nr:hypothetical protein DID77_02570 [Candidatus Marinamargulisbacteria bacterium SCGC AG-439-L15]